MPIIRHEWKGLDFGRVFGGLAWPSDKPGFAVIVGEERFPAIGTKDYHCYLIAEVEEQSLQSLIAWCAELAAIYNVQNFYGRRHPPCIRYLNVRNREVSERGLPEFRVSQTPNSEDGFIEYHINILLHRLSNEHQTLHLHKDSRLPGYLTAVPANGISTATESQFPAVAALGYAISALTIYKPRTEVIEYRRVETGRNPISGY